MIHMHNVGMEASYPSAGLFQFSLVKWLMDNIIMCVWGGSQGKYYMANLFRTTTKGDRG